MSWETSRAWHLVRPLVYYLREDFVPPAMAAGATALDFSAGLGDLSRYLLDSGARSVVATLPEESPSVPDDGVEWRTGVAAGQVATSFPSKSFDLATARMVFQFPTWEGDAADPDTLTQEFASVLRPGGRLVLAFHEFIPFEQVPARGDPPRVDDLLEGADPGRAALVRYLGLPPREGPLGESGFGLKVPMMVTTLQGNGFDIETADHPEPFTFPSEIESLDETVLTELGGRVMAVKQKHLSEADLDPYRRPALIREMLVELGHIYSFVTWPIVRIVARRR
jgi:SAM-dependent methyltransferase